MYQNPPIPALVLNPFLEDWAILLFFIEQLIISLRVILSGRTNLKRNISKPEKWTHKTAVRGFRWLQWVAPLCSFHILGSKVGKRNILSMGKALFLRFYYCSLSSTLHPCHHQAQRSDCPFRSFHQARESICSSYMHADRQRCTGWRAIETYASLVKWATCLATARHDI